MKTGIYYFSGTGNSLVVASDIAEKTNGKPCYNWRPKKAIYGGISDKKGYHYHHPSVEVSDLFR